MQSEIKVFSHPNGEIQRVQLVRWGSWEELDFLKLSYAPGALDCFAKIYRQYLVPACPWLFGNMVMFHLPEGMEVPFSFVSSQYGKVNDPLTAAAMALEAGVKIQKGKPVFQNAQVEHFWKALESQDCIRIVSGKLPITTIIPVGNLPGYLSQTEETAALKVNSSFFIMDRFDCATIYDHIGAPIGLCIKDGVVENPPQYLREALLVRKDGSVSIEIPDLRQMEIKIGGVIYRHGENATLYSRPHGNRVVGKGKKLVLAGRRVAAVQEGFSVPIPASGFVLRVGADCPAKPGDLVTYRGYEDVSFGIQVGNSIVIDGKKTEKFQSRYYNIRALQPIPFPPSLYPLNYRDSRAARIALGADAQGKPMLLWAEGAAKLGHVSGQDSRGASLADMAEICSELGMVNAVNLDGGGSAQILLNNVRQLRISDRNPGDYSEAERPVPVGLFVK